MIPESSHGCSVTGQEKSDGHKLKHTKKIPSKHEKTFSFFLKLKVLTHCHGLPRQGVESPSSEISNIHGYPIVDLA